MEGGDVADILRRVSADDLSFLRRIIYKFHVEKLKKAHLSRRHISANIWNFDKIFSWVDASCSSLQLFSEAVGLNISRRDLAHCQKWYYFAYIWTYG